MDSELRGQMRLWWRAYAATQGTPNRAWGMAEAIYRYHQTLAARGQRHASDRLEAVDGPLDRVVPISRIGRIDRI